MQTKICLQFRNICCQFRTDRKMYEKRWRDCIWSDICMQWDMKIEVYTLIAYISLFMYSIYSVFICLHTSLCLFYGICQNIKCGLWASYFIYFQLQQLQLQQSGWAGWEPRWTRTSFNHTKLLLMLLTGTIMGRYPTLPYRSEKWNIQWFTKYYKSSGCNEEGWC